MRDQVRDPDGFGDGRRICEALGFDPINHHNALKCPYCNPNGLVLAPATNSGSEAPDPSPLHAEIARLSTALADSERMRLSLIKAAQAVVNYDGDDAKPPITDLLLVLEAEVSRARASGVPVEVVGGEHGR